MPAQADFYVAPNGADAAQGDPSVRVVATEYARIYNLQFDPVESGLLDVFWNGELIYSGLSNGPEGGEPFNLYVSGSGGLDQLEVRSANGQETDLETLSLFALEYADWTMIEGRDEEGGILPGYSEEEATPAYLPPGGLAQTAPEPENTPNDTAPPAPVAPDAPEPTTVPDAPSEPEAEQDPPEPQEPQTPEDMSDPRLTALISRLVNAGIDIEANPALSAFLEETWGWPGQSGNDGTHSTGSDDAGSDDTGTDGAPGSMHPDDTAPEETPDAPPDAEAFSQSLQTIDLRMYTLRFEMAQSDAAGTGSFDILWNDEPVQIVTPERTHWQHVTLYLEGTGGLDQLTFRPVPGDEGGQAPLLNAVELEIVPLEPEDDAAQAFLDGAINLEQEEEEIETEGDLFLL